MAGVDSVPDECEPDVRRCATRDMSGPRRGCRRSRPACTIVNLAGLEFIDSSGGSALVRGRCCGC